MQGIIHQRLEHRRRQALEVVVGSASNDAGDEFRRILEQLHERIGVLEHACWHHLGGALLAEQEDRQTVVAPALCRQDLLQQLPLVLASFSAVDRDEPARLVVEHLG